MSWSAVCLFSPKGWLHAEVWIAAPGDGGSVLKDTNHKLEN